MDLVVAATAGEVEEVRQLCPAQVQFLVAGVGLVETTYNLTTYLTNHPEISRVINVGIAGGFATENIKILDVCLATSETIADLGICFDTSLAPLDQSFLVNGNDYPCENRLFDQFNRWLVSEKQVACQGPFLSVNGASGTLARGKMLNRNHAICENMEGAGVARVCHGFNLDWLEVRAVANLVEDRDRATWRIEPAIKKYAGIVASFLKEEQA